MEQADHFYYLYGDHSADGEITTQVISIEQTDAWAKAGVMFRESTAAGSKEISIVVRPDKQVVMQYRDTTDGSSESLGLLGGTANVKWIKLVREGDLFTGFYSFDGESWILINSATVGMAASVLRGLAITSHNDAELSTAAFNMVPPAPSGLTAASIGGDQIDLDWNPSVCATAYNLKRSTTNGGPYISVSVPFVAINYKDTGLLAGTGYHYVVSAEYLGVEGNSSAEVSAVPSALIDPEAVEISSGTIVDDGLGGQNLSFSIGSSFLGHDYRIQSSENLVAPNWQNASGVIPGNGGELHIEIPMDSGQTNRFYRLETWRK